MSKLRDFDVHVYGHLGELFDKKMDNVDVNEPSFPRRETLSAYFDT